MNHAESGRAIDFFNSLLGREAGRSRSCQPGFNCFKMAYTIRYQVFLSSTFTDLKDERAEVIQALWELDCIPTGMEAFLASSESQWEVISRVIDECDYYILIIGGRYGSVSASGVSYTEREFLYAQSRKLPILAFVHGEPDQSSVAKSETALEARQKLDAFRALVMKSYPVRMWKTAHELGGLVSRSLIQEIRRTPRPGWVRNDGTSPVELLANINELTQENLALKEQQINMNNMLPIDDLSSGTDRVILKGTIETWPRIGSQSHRTMRWTSTATWDEVFKDIGPALINEATESDIKSIIGRFCSWDQKYDESKNYYGDPNVDLETFAELIVQFRALGLVDKGIKRRGVNDKGAYWRLTEYGDRYLVSLLAQRRDVKAQGSVPSPTS